MHLINLTSSKTHFPNISILLRHEIYFGSMSEAARSIIIAAKGPFGCICVYRFRPTYRRRAIFIFVDEAISSQRDTGSPLAPFLRRNYRDRAREIVQRVAKIYPRTRY